VGNLICESPRTNQEALSALEGRVLQRQLLCQSLLEPAHFIVLVHGDGLASACADQTVSLLLVGERGDTQTRLTEILHVVIHALVDTRQQLECLVDARSGNEGIRGGDCGYDILDDAHCFLVVDALDAVLGSSLARLLADPLHVIWAVLVDGAIMMLIPFDDESVLDAVLGEPRSLLDRAERVSVIRGQCVHRTLITSCDVWNDHSGLTLEAFRAAVDQERRDSFLTLGWIVDLVYH